MFQPLGIAGIGTEYLPRYLLQPRHVTLLHPVKIADGFDDEITRRAKTGFESSGHLSSFFFVLFEVTGFMADDYQSHGFSSEALPGDESSLMVVRS